MEVAVSASRSAEGIRPGVFGAVLGWIAAALAAAVTVGWLASVTRLVRTGPGPASLSFNGAVSLGALGLAAAALCWRGPGQRSGRIAAWTAAATAVAGFLAAGSLIEDSSGRSLGLDGLLMRHGHPGRVAAEVSVAVLLLAAGASVELWWPRRAAVAAALVSCAAAVSLVAATEVGTARMALPTVVLLWLLALSLLFAVADRAGPIHVLWLERSVRASLLRAFVLPLPLIAVAPLVVCAAVVGNSRQVFEIGTATVTALVLASAWVGSRVAARMTRALTEVTATARQIAGGHLDTPVRTQVGDDEIGQLAAAFDLMRADLQSEAKIRQVVNDARTRASAAPHLAGAFTAFAQRLAAEVPFDRVTYVRPTGTGQFRVEAIAGPRAGELAVGDLLAVEISRSTRLLGPDSVVIDDLQALPEEPAVGELLSSLGTRSLLTVPNIAGGQVGSLLAFGSSHAAVFGPREATLLRAAVRETAVVFDILVNLERERTTVERLEEIDRQKNDFIGMVTHDLRSPMSVIAGFADTLRLQWNRLSPSQREEILWTISRNVLGLSAMVEDMLDVARIESGDYSYNVSPFPLDALVRRTTTELIQAHAGREAAIVIDDDLPLANADEQRVWQVLNNLLSNACKFSDDNEPIAVRVTIQRGLLRVAVSDRGPGVPSEDRDLIFDKYARLPSAPGRPRVEGTGLGLYISKLLIEAQGGQIGVDDGPGSGATFWFTVPAGSRPRPTRGAVDLASDEPPVRR
jgi:signal transduction histidine kinase/HAMP domain-containing protein